MEPQFYSKEWLKDTVKFKGMNLLDEISLCKRCIRSAYCAPVKPEGDENAELLLHGVSPGRIEMETGRPFSPDAPGGRMLGAYLGLLGVPREKCYMTNAVFCGQPKDRLPTFDESKACMWWKWWEYSKLTKLKGMVLMGNDAVRQVLGFTYPSLSQTNGKIVELTTVGVKKVKALLVFHPGYLLRKPKLRVLVKDALLNFRRVLDETDPTLSR